MKYEVVTRQTIGEPFEVGDYVCRIRSTLELRPARVPWEALLERVEVSDDGLVRLDFLGLSLSFRPLCKLEDRAVAGCHAMVARLAEVGVTVTGVPT